MSLPSSALTYQRQIGAEKLEALDAVNRQWSRMGTDFDAGWIRVGPQITRIVTTAQLRMAQAAADYLPSALAEVGLSSQLAGQVVPGAFAGVNGQNGLPLAEALSFSVVRAKMSVAEGAQAGLALQRGGQWLTLAAGTAMADAGRSAEAAGLAASSATGFVRMLNPPSCPRCVVLAGRWYRWNAGFDRHPGCDCRGVPASEDVAGDMTTDPYAYFESLSPAQRIRDFGASDALAIEEGADIFQVVNARRGMTAAGRFTREGTTRRGYFRSGTEAGRAGRRRLSVQEIVRRSGGDRAAARELLRRYGYITEQGQNPHGVIRMGAGSSSGGIRRVSTGAGGTRRPTPPTAPGPATSGAGGGAKPPRPPRAAASVPDPDPGDDMRDPKVRAYWSRRQAQLDVDTRGERLEPHEVRFLERFTVENRVRWIPKDQDTRKPTSDFEWLNAGGMKVELKSTQPKYQSVKNHILRSVSKAQAAGVVKENFIIDLGDRRLSEKLLKQLALYNLRTPSARISRLWVMSRGELVEVDLSGT
ncbi:hypothetical protein GCM10009700_31780 [Brevibacterium sanguinis]|uniref:hypothetical protein n=1 Tax=Brevibacterium sanguinis TaxID=232444 RepID=UPI0031D2881F